MFTTISKTSVLAFLATCLLASSTYAQLGSAFAGNGNSGQSPRQQQQTPFNSFGAGNQGGQQQTPSVVGDWYFASEDKAGKTECIYSFKADGTMWFGVMTTPHGGQAQKQRADGRYSVSGDQLKIQYESGDSETLKFQVDGTRLKMVLPNQQVVEFSLVQDSGSASNQPNTQRPTQPQPPTQTANNSMTGTWLMSVNENGGHMDVKMVFNPNGTYHMEMKAQGVNGNTNLSLDGRWKVNGNMLVLETDGEIEQVPMQFNGQTLALDLEPFGLRFILARNAQNSSLQPLQQGQGGGYSVGNQGGNRISGYQGGQPYSGNMANRW